MADEAAAVKPWLKPQLTIIARAKPDEAVLLACKYAGPAVGPNGANFFCRTSPCEQCSSQTSS